MALVHRMSIYYLIEQRKKEKKNQEIQESKETIIRTDILTEEMINAMSYFGFNFNQIWIAYKEYKFTSIENAIYVMMKDPETKKYHHKFFENENKENKVNDVSLNHHLNNNSFCAICGEAPIEHSEYAKDQEKPNQNLINISKTKFDLNPDIVSQFEDDNLCKICYANKLNPSNPKEKLICGHIFCISCIQNHLTTRITNGQVKQIKCLSAGCIKFFTTNEIKTYVDQIIINKYFKFYNNQVVHESNDNKEIIIINCPHPDCECYHEYNIFSKEINLKCENGHKFCVKCKNEVWHEQNCNRLEEILMRQIKANDASINIKLCPSCRILIEKTYGCNQMKCIQCNYEFCWLCLKQYEPLHYAYYNVSGCPGKKYYKTENTDDIHERHSSKIYLKIGSCLLATVVFFLLIFFYLFFGCSYEFVKCYLIGRLPGDDSSQISDFDENEEEKKNNDQEGISNIECTFSKILICILLSIIGVFLQPFYLFFYFIMALAECYRRYPCFYWFTVSS